MIYLSTLSQLLLEEKTVYYTPKEKLIFLTMITLKKTNNLTLIKDSESLTIIIHNSKFKYLEGCVEFYKKLKLLPCDELEKMAYTSGLKKEWSLQRQLSKEIGNYYIIKIFKIKEKPIEMQNPDVYMHLLLEAIANTYISTEKIIRSGFKILKKYLPNCPKKPESLFFQIIEEERNSVFESKLINDYIELKPNELAKIHTEMAKKDVNNIDIEKITKLMPSHLKVQKSTSLLNTVMNCLTENSDRTPKPQMIKINHCVNIHNENLRYLDEVLANGFEKRENQGKVIPTITYINGDIIVSDAGRNRRKIE